MCAEVARGKRRRASLLCVLCTSAALLACARSAEHIPHNWLPKAEEAGQEAFGAWVRVEAWNDEETAMEGELLAVGEDSLYVVDSFESVAIPVTEVGRIILHGYDANASGIAGWAVLGTLGTISHGWYLVLTGPVWIVGGIMASYQASRAGRQQHTTEQSWPTVAAWMRPYARFPAGMPPELDRNTLVIKRPPATATPGATSPWSKNR